MLLWLLIIGGVGALFLAYMAVQGPSPSKSLKRRVDLIKERHGDVIAGSAQAQIRKLFAERASKFEGYASTLIPKPALLRQRLEQTGKEISLGKYAMVCGGVWLTIASVLMPPSRSTDWSDGPFITDTLVSRPGRARRGPWAAPCSATRTTVAV